MMLTTEDLTKLDRPALGQMLDALAKLCSQAKHAIVDTLLT